MVVHVPRAFVGGALPVFDMFTVADRLASFRWEIRTSRLVRDMAKAGFFSNPSTCSGSALPPDAVTCFDCGLTLASWCGHDDPHSEHMRRNPNCEWIWRQERIMAIDEWLSDIGDREGESGAREQSAEQVAV